MFNDTIVTGDEGVIHGITQTDASVVVASQELAPRLIRHPVNIQHFMTTLQINTNAYISDQ